MRTLCELIAVGDELTSGAIADTNSAHAAETLREKGFAVDRVTVVGDDPGAMRAVFEEVAARAAFVIVGGGLGPTEDDRTASTAAALAGRPVVFHEAAMQVVRARFERMGRTMLPNNRKQAMLPEGSELLDNPIGTAPGFALRHGECRLFFLPGVPSEYRRMLAEQVLPRMGEHRGADSRSFGTRVLRMFGQGESRLAAELDGLELPAGLGLGWRPKFPEVQLRLYAEAVGDEVVRTILDDGERLLRSRLSRWIYGIGDTTLPEAVGYLLRRTSRSLTVAESCTGGLVTSLLIGVPGSSAWFERGFVAYANRAKNEMLGVPVALMERHGAVSEPVALAMAAGARATAGADLALAITGIAGPDGGTADKPVGTVFVALDTERGGRCKRLALFGERNRIRTMSAYAALEIARRHLIELVPDEPL